MSASRSLSLAMNLFGATVLMLLVGVRDARAGCNVIPVVAESYQSENGSVRERIAAPEGEVHITLRTCDSPQHFPAGDVAATLNIDRPGGLSPASVALSPDLSNCDPYGDCSACTFGNCNTVEVKIPKNPGAAGTAEIVVTKQSDGSQLAKIRELYEPNNNCLKQGTDGVFGQFVVLPEPNPFEELTDTNGNPELRLVADKDGNLLLPLVHDRTGQEAVYEKGRGRFYHKQLSFEAVSTSFSQATRFPAGGDRLVRAFTIDGRSIAPIFDFDADGNFFGLADVDRSVLRFRKRDGNGVELYDVGHRVDKKSGTVLIKKKFLIGKKYEAQTCHDAVPFDGLRTTSEVLAFAHPNTGSGRNVQVHDLEVAGETCDTNTKVPTGDPPSIEAGGPLTASVEYPLDALAVFNEKGSRLSDSSCDPLKVDKNGNIDGRVFAVEQVPGQDWIVYFITSAPANELWVFDRQQPSGSKCRRLGAANRASVWAGHALLRDPNGGNVTAYDYGSGKATSLAVSGELLAVGRDVAALTTPMGSTAGLAVVWLWPAAANAPTLPGQDAGAHADLLDVTYATSKSLAWVVVITPESAQGSDLNGDGDQNDRVLRLYEPSTKTLVTPEKAGGLFSGWAAEEFVVGGELIAFRTAEADQGSAGTDLNADGDECDNVMHFVNLEGRDAAFAPMVGSVGRQALGSAAVPWSNVTWRTAYTVSGGNILFVTDEASEGGTMDCDPQKGCKACPPQVGCNVKGNDLDRDGDACDVVLQAFSLKAGIVQPIRSVADTEAPILTKALAPTAELEIGLLIPGTNTLAIGDVDADGIFDQVDNCAGSNAGQVDDDLDGRGDGVCDSSYCDPFVPVVRLQPMGEPCLPSVGVAADDYLRARANATRLCLDGLIDGSRQGDPGQLCRGQFVGSVENAPALWAGRERKVVTESERALRREIAECRSLIPPRSGQPARISSDRVVRAYGESVIAATRVSYGEAVPIRDDAVRKCQEHLAAASVNFLAVSSQAMQACIAANLGREDLGAHCLGRLTGGVLDLPRDERARKIIGSAANRLDIAVRENCTNASLEQLDACASDIEGVRNCLQCTNWRRAVDTVASLHGPIDPGPWAESGH